MLLGLGLWKLFDVGFRYIPSAPGESLYSIAIALLLLGSAGVAGYLEQRSHTVSDHSKNAYVNSCVNI